MDPAAFDRLSRRLGATGSRRMIGRALLGALAGLLTGDRPADVVAQPRARCRPLGRACVPERGLDCCPGTTCRDGRCGCARGKRRCGDRCIRATRCCGTRCSGGAICRNDRCVCPQGRKRCQGRCIPQGQCCRDRECGPGRVCANGRCRCRSGFKPCQGRCIPDGACCQDRECAAGQACAAGRCTCTGASCPGCCAEATCHAESTATHCKGPGLACEVCGPEELCGEATCGCVPDPASCLPVLTPCPNNDCSTCCSMDSDICGQNGARCCRSALPGQICGHENECWTQGFLQDCQCNRCCVRSGLPADTGGGTCATCCSGGCSPEDPAVCA